MWSANAVYSLVDIWEFLAQSALNLQIPPGCILRHIHALKLLIIFMGTGDKSDLGADHAHRHQVGHAVEVCQLIIPNPLTCVQPTLPGDATQRWRRQLDHWRHAWVACEKS